jgi:hypothetical protein
MVVAKKRISGLVEPLLAGGVCFAVAILMPWLAQPIIWPDIGLRVWFCLGGSIFVWAGIKGWRPQGAGLVFTADGIRWNMPTFGSKVPAWQWDQIAGARLVSWRDEYNDEEFGVLIELKPDVPHPFGPKWAKWSSKELSKRFGETIAGTAVLLYDDKWDWNPEQVAQWINESASDPVARERWTTD